MRRRSHVCLAACTAAIGAFLALWTIEAAVGALVGGVWFGYTLPWLVKRMHAQDVEAQWRADQERERADWNRWLAEKRREADENRRDREAGQHG